MSLVTKRECSRAKKEKIMFKKVFLAVVLSSISILPFMGGQISAADLKDDTIAWGYGYGGYGYGGCGCGYSSCGCGYSYYPYSYGYGSYGSGGGGFGLFNLFGFGGGGCC
jgi:hypothetical protein